MQVDPIKYTFKAPGTTHLNLKYDNPLSNFAFNSNARRYTEALDLISHMLVYSPALRYTGLEACCHVYFDELRDPAARLPNGRGLHSSTFQLNLSRFGHKVHPNHPLTPTHTS